MRYLTSGLPQLSDTERAELELVERNLLDAVRPAAGDDVAKLAAVTKMLVALSGSNVVDDAVALAKSEAYMTALSDVPAWAVHEAVEGWYAGTVKDVRPDDFKWEPGPGRLAIVCRSLLEPLQEEAERARWLLDARPLAETIP